MSPFTQSALCQTQVGIWATVKVCCLGSPLPRPSQCYITCPASQTGNALDLCCLLPPGQRPLTWHMAWKGRLTLGWLTLCHCLVAKLCPTLCDPVTCSTPSFAALHYLPELTQTHVHWASDAIQPSHSLSTPSPALNLPQQQGLFQWVSSLHQVARVLELQLQHQSFQGICRVDFL